MVTTSATQDPISEIGTKSPRDADGSFASLTNQPLPAAPPAIVIRAAMALRRLLLRAADAVCPPEVVIIDRTNSLTYPHKLGAVSRLRIADLLEEGPYTA